MPEVVRITTGRTAKLGKTVEVRELSVAQWLKRQEGGKDNSGLSMLADMLYIDGEPIGDVRLGELGMGEIKGALAAMNEILGTGDDDGEQGND